MHLGRQDVVIAGAGVIGLAIARALSGSGRSVLVIEAAASSGTGVSSRNSEVIHAGIYYPPGSLKARLCATGRDMLYRYCEARAVAHRRVGKLVVATERGQERQLEAIASTAATNGVDAHLISSAQATALEPRLRCVAALHSPSTGIVDSHGLMLALQGDAQAYDTQFAFNTTIEGCELRQTGIDLFARDRASGSSFTFTADCFVNAAGLGAPSVAASLKGLPDSQPRGFLARGCYFSLRCKAPFARLVYPIPEHGGLGVHLTLDLGGRARFGPDVEWIDDIDYRVDPGRADAFYSEIRRYWPALPEGALQPDYAGIRPKISGPDAPPADFRIDGPREHGVAGCVNLFGIESPGLTAALAIAELVREKLLEAPKERACS